MGVSIGKSKWASMFIIYQNHEMSTIIWTGEKTNKKIEESGGVEKVMRKITCSHEASPTNISRASPRKRTYALCQPAYRIPIILGFLVKLTPFFNFLDSISRYQFVPLAYHKQLQIIHLSQSEV